MIETYIRPFYQSHLINYIARWMKGISPTHVTCLACLTGMIVAPLLVFNLRELATIFLLTSGFLDTLDGSVARERGMSSSLGSVLDIVSDRIVELAVIFGLFMVDPINRSCFSLAMLGSCYLCVTSFLVVGIFIPNHTQKGFHYSPGLMERVEAFIFFIAMIWLPDYFNLLAMLFVFLVLLSSFMHIRQFIKYESTQQPLVMAKTKLVYTKRQRS